MINHRSIDITITITPSPDLLALIDRLTVLLEEPEYLQRLLRLAVSRTFLKAYRTQMLARLPEALHMRRVRVRSKARQPTKDALRALSDAHEAYSDANAIGDHEAAQAAGKRVSHAVASVAGMLQGESTAKNTLHELVARAFQVMALFTDAGALGVSGNASTGVSVGIGNLERLNAIETPTANKSGYTDSAMKILWRQLEFGTGVFSKDPEGNPGSRFKEDDGTWWWGKERGRGLHMKGSKGIGMLRLGNDVANSPEGMQFDQVVTALLREALTV